VLVWVVDPQKYADPSLHERFVSAIRAHEGRFHLVVLNQIDTLEPGDTQAVAFALTELLVNEGFPETEVVLTSAVSGEGVEGLREELIAQTAHHTTAMRRTAADLSHVAGGLLASPEVALPGAGEVLDPAWVDRATERAIEGLMDLVLVEQPSQPGIPLTRPSLEDLRRLAVEWTALAAGVVPEVWAAAVGYSLASVANLSTRLDEALADLKAPPRPSWFARVFRGAKTVAEWRAAFRAEVLARMVPIVERTLAAPSRAVMEDRQCLAEQLAWVVAMARELPAEQRVVEESA
jgi:hypothetical protein